MGAIKDAEKVADKATARAETAVADSAKADAKVAEIKAVDARVVADETRREADKVS